LEKVGLENADDFFNGESKFSITRPIQFGMIFFEKFQCPVSF
jgi:hypothetical protein